MYQYIYYRLYKIAVVTEKLWSPGMRIPEWVAIVLMLIFLLLNALTVLIFHAIITKHYVDLNNFHAVSFLIVIFLINYFLFIRNQRYLKIAEKFDKETKRQKIKKTIFFLIYVFFSIGSFIGSLSL